jgi:hypothetical protein
MLKNSWAKLTNPLNKTAPTFLKEGSILMLQNGNVSSSRDLGMEFELVAGLAENDRSALGEAAGRIMSITGNEDLSVVDDCVQHRCQYDLLLISNHTSNSADLRVIYTGTPGLNQPLTINRLTLLSRAGRKSYLLAKPIRITKTENIIINL